MLEFSFKQIICFGSRRLRIFGMMPCLQFRTLRQPVAIPQCQTAQFAVQTSQDPIFQGYADLTMTWFARFTSTFPTNLTTYSAMAVGERDLNARLRFFGECRGLIATSNVCGKKSPQDNVDGSEIRLSPVDMV